MQDDNVTKFNQKWTAFIQGKPTKKPAAMREVCSLDADRRTKAERIAAMRKMRTA